ncbi:MAG: prephenate dehydrogenase, partial [Bacteroidota bacterium]
GLGLIGGSYAQTLRDRGLVEKIWGVDRDIQHQEEALSLGLVDQMLPLEEAISQSKLVLLAVPVQAVRILLPKILDQISPDTVVFDAGSTKLAICEAVKTHPRRGQFVAIHPIAGTENSGPKAARLDLLPGKLCILCEKELSTPRARQKIEQLHRDLGMELLYMSAEEHDKHLAYISHISHLTSFSLALAVLRAEEDEEQIFQFAGSGFASTARLGKSSPEMWASIFLDNQKPLLEVLDKYLQVLESFREMIRKGDRAGMLEWMTKANEIRRILDKQKVAKKDKDQGLSPEP